VLPPVSYTSGMNSIRTFGAVLAVAAGGLAIGACGSSSNPSSASSKRDAMLAFAQCMRTHGVPSFPDPGSNGRGGLLIQQRAGSGGSLTVNGVSVSSPAFQLAMQTCRSKLPNGGRPQPPSASQRAQMFAFSRCMRAHGVTSFPDPTFSASGAVGINFDRASGIDPSSPAFQSAQKVCGKNGGGILTARP
jgi:hypothetical protein